MSREIKFRAWDTKYNQILYGGESWKRYPKWYNVDFITNKGVVIWNKLANDASQNAFECQQIKMNIEIVIMQFTGLLDKNGKEIYEGDVIGYDRESNDRDWSYGGKTYFPVEWDYLRAMFIVVFDPNLKAPYSLYDALRKENIKYKIFGNIYENPELLTP